MLLLTESSKYFGIRFSFLCTSAAEGGFEFNFLLCVFVATALAELDLLAGNDGEALGLEALVLTAPQPARPVAGAVPGVADGVLGSGNTPGEGPHDPALRAGAADAVGARNPGAGEPPLWISLGESWNSPGILGEAAGAENPDLGLPNPAGKKGISATESLLSYII